MSQAENTPEETESDEDGGRLYLWGGVLSAITSWVLVPLAGLAAVYCGYKLYDEQQKTTSSALIAGFGGIGVLAWMLLLAMA